MVLMNFRVAAACLMLFSGISAAGCGSNMKSPTDPSQNLNVPFSQIDLVVGTGRVAAAGNVLNVNYALWLYDGSKADNKGVLLQSGPFPFTLGAGQVIPGFDQGVAGMAVGGIRRLTIPPSLAYGANGSPQGGIPGNATIIFEVQLVSIQ
jgi:FKBP-type peptidyl-prolyl cis-trans isomerase